jgi:hypothetical protein
MDGLATHEPTERGVDLSILRFRHEERGLTFEISAPEALGVAGWRGVQAMAAAALSVLSSRTGRDASFWFEPLEGLNHRGEPDLVLRISFVLDYGAEPTELEGAAVRRELGAIGVPVREEGLVPLSDGARPSMVLAGGELHQVWLMDPPDAVAVFVAWNEETEELEVLGARRHGLDEADLLACIRHVLLLYPDGALLCT